jgi:hypothetical protein
MFSAALPDFRSSCLPGRKEEWESLLAAKVHSKHKNLLLTIHLELEGNTSYVFDMSRTDIITPSNLQSWFWVCPANIDGAKVRVVARSVEFKQKNMKTKSCM